MQVCFNINLSFQEFGDVDLRINKVELEFLPRQGDVFDFDCLGDLVVMESKICHTGPKDFYIEVDFQPIKNHPKDIHVAAELLSRWLNKKSNLPWTISDDLRAEKLLKQVGKIYDYRFHFMDGSIGGIEAHSDEEAYHVVTTYYQEWIGKIARITKRNILSCKVDLLLPPEQLI